MKINNTSTSTAIMKIPISFSASNIPSKNLPMWQKIFHHSQSSPPPHVIFPSLFLSWTNSSALHNAKAFSFEEANSLIAANTEEPKKEVVSKDLSLVCTALPTVLNYESIEINCLVKNKKTTPIGNIQICYEQTCQTIDSLRTEQNTN